MRRVIESRGLPRFGRSLRPLPLTRILFLIAPCLFRILGQEGAVKPAGPGVQKTLAVASNDSWLSPRLIGGASGRSTGSTVGYSKENGEPNHAGAAGGRSGWWLLVPSRSGRVTLDTAGSSFDTVLAVYLPNNINFGTIASRLQPVVSNDNFGTLRTSSVTFDATQDVGYLVAVDGVNGVGGSVVLNWAPATTAGGNDAFANRIVLTGETGFVRGTNIGYTREVGETALSSSASGRTAWWRFTSPAAGRATLTTAGSAFDTILGVFTGSRVDQLVLLASNNDGPVGVTSQIELNVVAGGEYSVAVDGRLGVAGSIVLNYRLPAAPPSNDMFVNATRLEGDSGQVVGSNLGFSVQAGEPSPVGLPGGRSAWWTWTAPASGSVRFDTVGSGFDTVLGVYTGSAVDQLVRVAANDDSSGTASRVVFVATAGTQYRIVVDGISGNGGSIQMAWNLARTPPPNERPDLVVSSEALRPRLEYRDFQEGDCGTSEGCALPGRRRLLTFETQIRNQGFRPLVLEEVGTTSTNLVFNLCQGVRHWRNGIRIRLVSPGGGVAAQRTAGVQMTDGARWSATNGPASAVFTLANQGLSVGWSAVSARNLNCQWLDVTDVPEGDYFLEVEADPLSTVPEFSETNNIARVPVQVFPATAPSNDLFASARRLHGPRGWVQGDSAWAGRESGEIRLGLGGTVWFRWTAPCNGSVTFATEGSRYDTMLGVVRGDAVGQVTPTTSNDDLGTNTWSRVQFEAEAGREYRIQLEGRGVFDSGPYRLAWALSGSSCEPGSRPFVSERPPIGGPFRVGFFGLEGEPYAFEVSADLQGWLRLGTMEGEGRLMEFVDETAVSHSTRYYRVVQVVR